MEKKESKLVIDVRLESIEGRAYIPLREYLDLLSDYCSLRMKLNDLEVKNDIMLRAQSEYKIEPPSPKRERAI